MPPSITDCGLDKLGLNSIVHASLSLVYLTALIFCCWRCNYTIFFPRQLRSSVAGSLCWTDGIIRGTSYSPLVHPKPECIVSEQLNLQTVARNPLKFLAILIVCDFVPDIEGVTLDKTPFAWLKAPLTFDKQLEELLITRQWESKSFEILPFKIVENLGGFWLFLFIASLCLCHTKLHASPVYSRITCRPLGSTPWTNVRSWALSSFDSLGGHITRKTRSEDTDAKYRSWIYLFSYDKPTALRYDLRFGTHR